MWNIFFSVFTCLLIYLCDTIYKKKYLLNDMSKDTTSHWVGFSEFLPKCWQSSWVKPTFFCQLICNLPMDMYVICTFTTWKYAFLGRFHRMMYDSRTYIFRIKLPHLQVKISIWITVEHAYVNVKKWNLKLCGWVWISSNFNMF